MRIKQIQMIKIILFCLLIALAPNLEAQNNKATKDFWSDQNVIKDFVSYALNKEINIRQENCLENGTWGKEKLYIILNDEQPWEFFPQKLQDSLNTFYINPDGDDIENYLNKDNILEGISFSSIVLKGRCLVVEIVDERYIYKRKLIGKPTYKNEYIGSSSIYTFTYNSEKDKWEPNNEPPETRRITCMSCGKESTKTVKTNPEKAKQNTPFILMDFFAQLDTILDPEIIDYIKTDTINNIISRSASHYCLELTDRWINSLFTGVLEEYTEMYHVSECEIIETIFFFYHDYLNGDEKWKAFDGFDFYCK